MSYFAFPTPRLQIVGDADGDDVTPVPPAALHPSPHHDSEFGTADNVDFIAVVRTAGTVGLLPARETPDGLELVDGHKRAWVARHAVLDTVAVRVLDLDDEAAAEAFAPTPRPESGRPPTAG